MYNYYHCKQVTPSPIGCICKQIREACLISKTLQKHGHFVLQFVADLGKIYMIKKIMISLINFLYYTLFLKEIPVCKLKIKIKSILSVSRYHYINRCQQLNILLLIYYQFDFKVKKCWISICKICLIIQNANNMKISVNLGIISRVLPYYSPNLQLSPTDQYQLPPISNKWQLKLFAEIKNTPNFIHDILLFYCLKFYFKINCVILIYRGIC